MGKSYANGPIADQQRKCTDVCCLVIFIFMSITVLSLTIYAAASQGINDITTPRDADGKRCGIQNKDYPYLYFVSPHKDSLARTVCVRQCPQSESESIDCARNSKVYSCVGNNSMNRSQTVEIYPSHTFLGRICLPQSKYLRDSILESLGVQLPQDHLNALYKNWLLIVLAIPTAIIVTLFIMLLIRFTACCTIYFIIILTILCFLALGYYAFTQSLHTDIRYFGISASLLYKIGAVIAVILAFIILISFCCFRKRINIAIKMIKASARFVNENCFLFFIPILKVIFFGLFLALWLIQLGGLLVFKDIVIRNQQVTLSDEQNKAVTIAIVLVHVFYLLWGMFFISQSGTFVVCGTVVNWYFKQESECSSSTSRYAGYHSGSVCASSFLIALFGFIKLVFELFKPDSAEDEDSVFAKIQKCCNCVCYLCVTFVFTILNRGAYAFIHLAGRSYCDSATKVLSLRINEPVLNGVMTFLETIFSLIVRIQIVAFTCLIAYFILRFVQPFKTQTSDPTMTLVVIGILALLVSEFFVPIYVQAADTIVVCFLVDKQYGQQEDKCPKQLQDYLKQTRQNDGFID